MAKLTPAQQRAVDETSKTLLVSAAAGSGKTTTLIERILRSVVRKENPVMLDRLLVVTFTKAAASELRLRISAALSDAIAADGENEVLAKQISLLPSAKISTIDSFCLDLVRTNYAALGLSPAFRIADTGESTLLAHETMERLIDECYDSPESKIAGGARGFADLVDLLLGSSDDKRLADLLLSLYETLSAYPRGAAALYDCEATLREYAKADFFTSPPGKRIEEHLRDLFVHYRHAYRYAMEALEANAAAAKTYLPAFSADYDGILRAETALAEGYAVGREVVSALTFPRLGSYRGEKTSELEQIKELRNEYKKQVAKLQSGYLAADNATLQHCVAETAEVCHALAELLCEYEKRAEAEKKRQNVCDFADLSRYTLRLLVDADGNDTPFATAQKGLYDAVYIDEYQDVNAVQDRIFSAISTETNRFMVGDIKQSIYAFRGAEPSIFANLRYAYPAIDDAADSRYATIFMSENFRCGREIIDFTNMVFDKLMPLISPDMHYTASDALVFRKNASDTVRPVQMVLTEKPPKDSPYAGENTEADFIAREICRLVKEERKDDGTPITYGDIAILMRSPKAKMDEYAGALRAHGVPVYAETNENLLLQSEVEILRCMLEAIDNPRRDIPLTGALLSPLCGLDCDFLAALRKDKREERLFTTLRDYLTSDAENCPEKQKLAHFIEQLAEFRRMARFMSAGELTDELYAHYAVYARLCADSALRRANLEKFRQLAHSFAGGTPRSLSEFLRYLRSVETSATAQLTAAKVSADTHDAVQIMSIHQSKGLEYPVVFLADTAKSYNLRDADMSPLYTNAAGFGMRLRDASGFCVYDTLLRKSVALALRRSAKEEELRLLYVALTRAREQLYITAMVDAPEKLTEAARFAHNYLSAFSALEQKSHLSLALLAAGGTEQPFLTIRTVPYFFADANEAPAETKTDAAEAPTADAESVRILSERFDYRYPHAARTKIPAKLSISRLYPDILDDTILEESIDEKKLPPLVRAPRFIENVESDAAKRGTATHLFLQFFDFDHAVRHGAAAELARLTEKHFLTAEDAALVNMAEVETFLASPLFAEMRAAKRLYREQRFNLELPAADFAADARLKEELAGETVLVQGVIDCFFYDAEGNIVLVDYKTDRLPKNRAAAEEKLRAAHARQLGYYARAIEEICEKAPKRRLIYSLCLGDVVSL